MKAFLIARVSTEDQEDALPGQIYKLNDYASMMNYDAELIQIKESAYSGKREVFNNVIAKVTDYNDECVVVFDKIDRLTRRSSSMEVTILSNLCMAGKLELHFISDHLIINQNSSAQESFMFNIGLSSAQYYSQTISDNVKRRQAQMLRDGIWTGAAPIGYVYSSLNGRKWIVPDEITSTYVKQTFKSYSEGFTSLKEIAKVWRNEYGIKTPHSRIESLLKNPFYYGQMRVKGKLYKHNYEPLITQELFESVQARLHGYQAKPHRWSGIPFAYRGLLSCAECGCAVTFELKKKKYIYGHCTQSKYHHNASYVSEQKLTDQIYEHLKKVYIPDDVLAQVYEAMQNAKATKHIRQDAERKRINAEILKYKTRLDRMYDDRLSGYVSDEIYEKKHKEFTQKQAKLNDHLQRLELLDSSAINDFSHLLRLANKLPDLFKKASISERPKILSEIYSNLCLNKDSLEVKYKKPFDLMAFCNENSTWQGY